MPMNPDPDPDNLFDLSNPKIRKPLEMLLILAAQKGEDDQVRERLAWGVDPNCRARRGRTPLIANAKGICPNVKVVQILLAAGADASVTDHAGLSALDYARRKLMKIQTKPRRRPRKSAALDENNQIQLNEADQFFIDSARRDMSSADAREYVRTYYQERKRAALRVFNDSEQVEAIVELLEGLADGTTISRD